MLDEVIQVRGDTARQAVAYSLSAGGVERYAARQAVPRAPRIHQYIAEGRLRARKMGQDVFIDERDVDTFERRPTGRPSTKADGASGRQP